MFKWLTGRGSPGPTDRKSNSLDVLRAYLIGTQTASGKSVTTEKALGVAVVLRCSKLLGNGCGQIPFRLYRRSADGKSREVLRTRDHPVAKLMGRRPNSWQSPGEWRRTMTMHAALCGMGLSVITRGLDGTPLELLPVRPSWVTWKQRDDWSIEYKVAWPNGVRDTYEQRDVFVLRAPSWDAVQGLAAVRYAREAIGLRLAVDEAQAKLFANGTRPGGLLISKQRLDAEQREMNKAAWREGNAGVENTGKDLLLEGDLDWKPMQLNNTDAETMALRGQQIEEICMAFDVFPQMVGYSGGKAPTFASAEQFFVNHVVHTLQPWHTAWEEACALQLLDDDEVDDGLYLHFTVQALMRGTAKERAEFLNLMVNMGAFNPNEVRALEEYDERPELNRYRIPMNTTVLDDAGMPVIPPRPNAPEPAPT